MIFVNGQEINFTSFPDGTTSFHYDVSEDRHRYNICWMYDGDHECILLWYLTKHIRSHTQKDATVSLILPYIPNARMDRVKNNDEVFTLKWFADFINALEFDEVNAYDPHSSVSAALFNNFSSTFLPDQLVKVFIMPEIRTEYTNEADDIILCYPDEGAAKRYSSSVGEDYVFCIKHRDWKTGKILSLELTEPEKVEGKTVLIMDDICSKGGTFTHTARALKNAGAGDIFLYVTHCENTIRDGLVLTDGLIRHVFTTNTIFRGQHEKIRVFHME